MSSSPIQVTAAQVKALRERTGAGMMECKRALEKTGDIEAAIVELRKQGQIKASERAGKIAAEGVIDIITDEKTALILEVNCETDFVARDPNFREFITTISNRGLAAGVTTVEALLALPYQEGSPVSIEKARADLVARIGENIQVRRLTLMQAQGTISSYNHGSRIGVLVDISKADKELAKDIAMHIAASNPLGISADDISEDIRKKEKEIFMAQAEISGKPADVIEKMVTGRVEKFVKDNSLLGQPFVKDTNKTVGDLLSAANAKVHQFVRYEVGEGITKQEENFADEVMAQVKGK